MEKDSKNNLIIVISIGVFVGLALASFIKFDPLNKWSGQEKIGKNSIDMVNKISEDKAIDYVRNLPEVKNFIAQVENTHQGKRQVSFHLSENENKQYFVVTVAESDKFKETTWKIFQVKKDGSEILVVNSLTGEWERYDQKNF